MFGLCHWHRTTIDARQRHSLLGSGHRDGSIFPSCALAFDSLTLRRAHFFCSSACSLQRPITNICAKLFPNGILAALLIWFQRLIRITVSQAEGSASAERRRFEARWPIDELTVCFDFDPHFEGAVQAWRERFRAVSPCAVGCDWLDHKQTRHAA
jgi:hypothetical protein